MNATHQVLDLFYTSDEVQECFKGTEEECYNFIKQQGEATFMFKVVPIIHNSCNINEMSMSKDIKERINVTGSN